MFRSRNSAPDLKRGEYDLDEVYTETEPLMADERSGWDVVRSERMGSEAGGGSDDEAGEGWGGED